MDFISRWIMAFWIFGVIFGKKFTYTTHEETVQLIKNISNDCEDYIKVEEDNSDVIIYFTNFNTLNKERQIVNVTATNSFSENIIKEFLIYFCMRVNSANYTMNSELNILNTKMTVITFSQIENNGSIVLLSGKKDSKIIVPHIFSNNEIFNQIVNYTHSDINVQKGINDYEIEKDTNDNTNIYIHLAKLELPTQISLGFDDNFDNVNQSLMNYTYKSYYGHITRNIRLLYYLIDNIGNGYFTYVSNFEMIKTNETDNTSNIISYALLPSGCHSIKLIEEYFIIVNDTNTVNTIVKNITLMNSTFFFENLINKSLLINKKENVECFWKMNENNKIANLIISFNIDQNFTKSKSNYRTRYAISFIKAISDQNEYFYSSLFLYSKKGEMYYIDNPENFLIDESDFTITNTIYNFHPDNVNNTFHVFPFINIDTSKSTVLSSQWLYNVSFAFFISTNGRGNSDALFYMSIEDAFLSIFSSNKKNPVYLLNMKNNITKHDCRLYIDDMSKKYYLLCDKIYQNVTLPMLKNEIVNTHIKSEVIQLNMTIYGIIGLNSKNIAKNYYPSKAIKYQCTKNYPLYIQKNITFYNEKEINNGYMLNITKINHTEYNLIFSYDNKTKLLFNTYVVLLPLNKTSYLIVDSSNATTFNQTFSYDTPAEIEGKVIKVLMLSNETELNSSFITHAFERKTKIDYEITQCGIMFDDAITKRNITAVDVFYNTHYVYHPSFFEKYFYKIATIGGGALLLSIIIIVAIYKIIKKKCNSGYIAVKTNKSYEI